MCFGLRLRVFSVFIMFPLCKKSCFASCDVCPFILTFPRYRGRNIHVSTVYVSDAESTQNNLSSLLTPQQWSGQESFPDTEYVSRSEIINVFLPPQPPTPSDISDVPVDSVLRPDTEPQNTVRSSCLCCRFGVVLTGFL